MCSTSSDWLTEAPKLSVIHKLARIRAHAAYGVRLHILRVAGAFFGKPEKSLLRMNIWSLVCIAKAECSYQTDESVLLSKELDPKSMAARFPPNVWWVIS